MGGNLLQEGHQDEDGGGHDPDEVDVAGGDASVSEAGVGDDEAGGHDPAGDEIDDGGDDLDFEDVGKLGGGGALLSVVLVVALDFGVHR